MDSQRLREYSDAYLQERTRGMTPQPSADPRIIETSRRLCTLSEPLEPDDTAEGTFLQPYIHRLMDVLYIAATETTVGSYVLVETNSRPETEATIRELSAIEVTVTPGGVVIFGDTPEEDIFAGFLPEIASGIGRERFAPHIKQAIDVHNS